MKKATLFSVLILISVIGFAQSIDPNQTQIRVSIKDTDSTMLINAIDLIGSWKSVASTSPILGNAFIPQVVEITNGNRLTINDAWTEDYPNKMKNCTWEIVDKELQFRSPDLGKMTIDVEKLKGSNFFELTINSYTYRKVVNLSSN